MPAVSGMRLGESLKEFDARSGDRSKKEDDRLFARRDAATDAGLSEHQAKTARRVANIHDDFEQVIEAEAPSKLSS